uniref:TMV resistance protein N-like n=1 Tax=Erigeron canadensis TaxID=72917 RepID=UPI001CB92B25|nr:TMV resistance protein N-like [Erigeron canadensis]
MASSSSFPPARGWTYDVFLSFRGEDTRYNFVDHLYDALKRNGIIVFKDDKELPLGEPISPELKKAIRESMYAVVVFSEKFAESSWCLDEVAEIMERRQGIGLKVLSVFYYIEPSDVRRQKGVFATDFQKHEQKYKDETYKVNNWRKALFEAANLSSLPISKIVKESESAIINKIVKKIFGDVRSCGIEKDLHLIGIESRINELDSKLAREATKDVRIVGVWGMGGIGKTTIAEALFRRISYKFEGSSFTNVSKYAKDICALQERIIGDILVASQGSRIHDPKHGANMIQTRLCNKRVLIVLDNVVDFKHLQFIAENRAWFGPGSRIIITTRDKRALKNANADDMYEPTILNENEAIELFSRYAFPEDGPLENYKELLNRAIRCSGYLPLALELLGRSFYGIDPDMWEVYLYKLENTRNTTIYETLKLSYDGLDTFEKKIFLDIACFFQGQDEECVTRVLDSFGFHAKIGIHILINKALITVSNKKIEMHDLIQEMGWEIASNENQNGRLWKLEEVHDFVNNNTKLEKLEAIVVPNKQNNVQQQLGFRSDVFQSMKYVRLLNVYRKFTSCEPTILPDELKWLCWNQYPFSSLPLENSRKLVGLEMHGGNIEHLWMGLKNMRDLKFIHLKKLECLKRFPDVSGAPFIERLVVSSCSNLVEVHKSLGSHKKLKYVDMSNCWKLKCFSSMIGMESLETLILSGCSNLERFPEVKSGMGKLSNIQLDGCSRIGELPSSISLLSGLSLLNLARCKSLKNIPNSICKLKCLKRLHLQDCVELITLPEEFGNIEKLQELQLGFTDSYRDLQRLPQSINLYSLKNFCSLRKLDLSWRHTEDKDFPKDLHAFSSLEKLNLSGNSELTELPTSIYHLSRLKHLELNECYRLKSLKSLPSGIQVLRASGCRSLEWIEDFPKEYEWLYKIWLVGCWNLPDQEDETNPSKMLLLSLLKKCASVNHRLSIAIPGSKIPTWFSAEQHGCCITLELQPGSHSNIMGFAVSGVFSRMWNIKDDYPVIKFTFVNGGKFFPMTEFENNNNDVSALEINTVWIGYIPFCSLQKLGDNLQGSTFAVSIRLQTGQLPVKCGGHIVYKEDVESIQPVKTYISDYCNSECVTRRENTFIYKDDFSCSEDPVVITSIQDQELIRENGNGSSSSHGRASLSYDMGKYLELERSEKFLFDSWRERKIITSGGLLLCDVVCPLKSYLHL